MKYLEGKFTLCPYTEIAADVLKSMLGENGFESFYDQDELVVGYIQEQIYDEQAVQSTCLNFPLDNVNVTFSIDKAEDKDWNEEWEKTGFTPINIVDRILIHSTEHQNLPHLEYDIVINPCLAFGTGSHETTSMIMQQMLQAPLKQKIVLDAGCGTGLLGILASKLDASEIFAYDIDEWSVENTITNCKLNNISNLNVALGDASVLKSVSQKFDVVLANINKNILLMDIPHFVEVMNPGAILIISGFYDTDVSDLVALCQKLHLTFKAQHCNKEWTSLQFVLEQ